MIQCACNIIKFARNLKKIMYIYAKRVWWCVHNRMHFSRLRLCNVFIMLTEITFNMLTKWETMNVLFD